MEIFKSKDGNYSNQERVRLDDNFSSPVLFRFKPLILFNFVLNHIHSLRFLRLIYILDYSQI